MLSIIDEIRFSGLKKKTRDELLLQNENKNEHKWPQTLKKK